MIDRCIIFYVFDDSNRLLDFFSLNKNTSLQGDKAKESENSQHKFRKKFDSCIRADGYFASIFIHLLKTSETYSQRIIENCNLGAKDSDVRIKIMLTKPKLQVLDYKWNERMSRLVFERKELDNAMSWLSTLGGAFSSLGDSFESCAKVAGEISVQQFKIALRLGEPPLVVRCHLYMALSLLQLGHLNIAKKVIEKQYEIAKQLKDIRLQNMCKGVWAKLQYMYRMKKNLQKNAC